MQSITHLTSWVFRSFVIGRVVQKTIFLYKIVGVPKWSKLNFFANPAYTILQLCIVLVYNRNHHVNLINLRSCDLKIELLQYNFFPNVSVSFFLRHGWSWNWFLFGDTVSDSILQPEAQLKSFLLFASFHTKVKAVYFFFFYSFYYFAQCASCLNMYYAFKNVNKLDCYNCMKIV